MSRTLRSLRRITRFFGIDSWSAVAWVVAGWVLVLGLFAVQYSIFGPSRFLGWDTSTYVEQAHEIQLFGLDAKPFQYSYPNLYFVLVWGMGSLVGDLGLAERVLPVVMGMILVAVYYRLGRELFRGNERPLAGVAAVLAALSVNTMRLMSDLHRNLFSLLACLLLLILLTEIDDGRRGQKSTLPWLVVLGAAAAFTQIETYAVVLLIVLIYAAQDLSSRWKVAMSTTLPVLVAAPFMLNFYATYPGLAFNIDPADPGLVPSDFVYFHGGLLPLLFLAVIGAAVLAYQAWHGPSMARFLLMWYGILMGLVGFLWVTRWGLPPYRPLYLVPIPILLTLAVRDISRFVVRGFRRMRAQRTGDTSLVDRRGTVIHTTTAVSLTCLVILATAAGLAAQKDLYLQPFINEQQFVELESAGDALRPYALSQPILLFAGYNGSWYYSMDEAYVGISSGPVLGYFGRPQFLLTLTDPLVAEPGLSNTPNPSRFAAARLFGQLKTAVSEPSALLTHPILVSGPGLYDRPVSDYFVRKHRVSTNLYLVLPSELTPTDFNTWVWFAAFDTYDASTFSATPDPRSISPETLVYATPSLATPWSVSYDMNLTESFANVTLSIHLLDTPPLPAAWNLGANASGGFTIYVDNTFVAHYFYGGQGWRWLNFTLPGLSNGLHTVRLQAGDLGKPFAVGLDTLVLVPPGIDLGTIVSAYTG